MNMQSKYWFILGGLGSFAVAALHIGIIIFGAPAYRFFGAGEEMAQLASSGSVLPALITLFIALVFTIWGLYAFSGAGVIRRLPLLRLGLVVIASIYSLRGLEVIFQLISVIKTPASASLGDVVFSLTSLLIGVVYFMGFNMNLGELKASSNSERIKKQENLSNNVP